MLPHWKPSAFNLHVDYCSGFSAAIRITLLVMLRYRRIIARTIGMQLIAIIANQHREEQWWPIEVFSMEPYM
jgi:hypothetical protein